MFKKQFWYEEICLDFWSRSRLQMAIYWSAILDTEKKSFPAYTDRSALQNKFYSDQKSNKVRDDVVIY